MNLLVVPVPLVMLAVAALLSAAETALFSLPASDRARAGTRAEALLAEPRELLITILLANVAANLMFFAMIPRTIAGTGVDETAAAFVALVVMLLAGEILPKTLALRVPLLVARAVALPLGVLVTVLGPLRRAVSRFVELMLQAVGSHEQEEPITADVLAQALEHSAEEGVLAQGEADLLAGIMELSSLRVREIMTPRVDALMLDLDADEATRAATLREAHRRRVTWLPAVRGSADNVAGYLETRDVLVAPERPIEQLVMPVKFVPEVARVLTLLHAMREDRFSEAVVVDEWGGTAGIVTVEDVFEELVGELRVEGEELDKPVVPLGEGRFRVSGGLSIRDWNELFGGRVVPNEFETVGGFVTALLGRIPRSGDRVPLGAGIVCDVREVRGRRVLSLDLFVEPGRTEVSV